MTRNFFVFSVGFVVMVCWALSGNGLEIGKLAIKKGLWMAECVGAWLNCNLRRMQGCNL